MSTGSETATQWTNVDCAPVQPVRPSRCDARNAVSGGETVDSLACSRYSLVHTPQGACYAEIVLELDGDDLIDEGFEEAA